MKYNVFMVACALTMLALIMSGQSSELEKLKSAEIKPKPPEISADVRAAFWRAALEKTQAETKFNDLVASMRLMCGAAHVLNQDGSGEPKCVTKLVMPTSTPNTKAK